MQRRLALLVSFCLVQALIAGMLTTAFSVADDNDKVDGAIWKFEMTPVKKRGAETLRGQFRVQGKFLYQKTTPKSKEFDKKIGEKTSTKGKTTRLQIDDLRARAKESGLHSGIKGKLVLDMDERGKWSGPFVDSEGSHWDFKCERFQE